MTLFKPNNALCCAKLKAGILLCLASSIVVLSSHGLSPAWAEDQSSAQVRDTEKFSLALVEGDLMRVDRETGDVTVCRKLNALWRCQPVPQAERAYELEIDRLSGDLASARSEIKQLEQALEIARAKPDKQAIVPGTDGASEKAPDQLAKEDKSRSAHKKEQESHVAPPPQSVPQLTDQDEQQFERFLDFSQDAMRRFFGFVKDLQNDLTDPTEG
ncbi:MAG: hypothetical protein HWE23_06210 [Rhodobacteraceae bacterium]|nr:hypothetical protein [Paracoccaceae bacterium]